MNILVIAAHPDDEVLGCGGTLLKLKKNNKIYLAYLADGVLGRSREKILDFNDLSVSDLKDIENRKKEARQTAKDLKAKIVNIKDHDFSFKFIDQRLDTYPLKEIADWISDQIDKIEPEIIYTHFSGDLNLDHRLVGEATLIAARPKCDFIKRIYAYEVSESTVLGEKATANSFLPNVFENLNPKDKVKLFKNYRSEWGHSSGWEKWIETQAKYRGLQSGYEFAEAFVLLRQKNE